MAMKQLLLTSVAALLMMTISAHAMNEFLLLHMWR